MTVHIMSGRQISLSEDPIPVKLSAKPLDARDSRASSRSGEDVSPGSYEAEHVQLGNLCCRNSPLQVLHLQKDELLYDVRRRIIFHGLHLLARMLPALVIYGGTICLLVCALCRYRWGVLLALTLFTLYMTHLCLTFLICSALGLFRVFRDSREDWIGLLFEHNTRTRLRGGKNGEDIRPLAGELCGSDVLHIVMLPTYKTPLDVLTGTLDALARSKIACDNIGVCLAFEEREETAREKEAELNLMFANRFKFMFATFHPPNLPDHLPGKSSNECWAFQQLCKELQEVHGIEPFDPRVVITVIDDDSEMHERYFEALTYHFVSTSEQQRYLTTWQPPICHFKNYLRQPMLVRISSIFSTLNELACLANPLDCHVPFSSYSISLVLASAVGGWDPDFLAEDWHMFAKCSLMTEGRVRCSPIFLPILNYTPEEDTYWATLGSRWTQAKRHALGVSELVYVISSGYLAVLELPSFGRAAAFVWRLTPLLGKFTQTHFVNGTAAIWNLLAQLVIHFYMFGSWCNIRDPSNMGYCPLDGSLGMTENQLLRNSLMVFLQQRATAVMASASILSGGLGAIYFHMVKDRIEGDIDEHWHIRILPLMWLVIELEVSLCGLVQSFIYGAIPLWIACLRVITSVRFTHVVAGMVGRGSDDPDDDHVGL
eukprot:TRINITY_DN63620_c0_g1_i1.p1 TRINITY_DN63620_c0_g1~~TRINITY_DN63620_c0_g1_i1.p1  ORF type:complete len:657 (-),score=90.91 TRINITY_DN63620_c0_g1_i1:40-2010(-)